MYEILSKDGSSLGSTKTLTEAIVLATKANVFVTIKSDDIEVCGIFGVDEVTDPKYNGWISRKKPK